MIVYFILGSVAVFSITGKHLPDKNDNQKLINIEDLQTTVLASNKTKSIYIRPNINMYCKALFFRYTSLLIN